MRAPPSDAAAPTDDEPPPGPAAKGKMSRAEKRQLMAQKFSAKRQVYENCRMLSMEGELLCYCDLRKVQWYEVSPSGGIPSRLIHPEAAGP